MFFIKFIKGTLLLKLQKKYLVHLRYWLNSVTQIVIEKEHKVFMRTILLRKISGSPLKKKYRQPKNRTTKL